MVLDGSAWHNALNPFDVNHDGNADAMDRRALRSFVKASSGPVAVPTLPDPNPQTIQFYDVDDNWLVDLKDLTLLTDSLDPAKWPDALGPASADFGDMSLMSGPSGPSGPADFSGASGPSGPTGPSSVTLDDPDDAYEGIYFELTGTISPPDYYSFEHAVTGNYGGFQFDPETGVFSVLILIDYDGPSPGNGTLSDATLLTMSVWPTGYPEQAVSDDTTVIVHNVAPTFYQPDYGGLLIDIYDYPLGGPYSPTAAATRSRSPPWTTTPGWARTPRRSRCTCSTWITTPTTAARSPRSTTRSRISSQGDFSM